MTQADCIPGAEFVDNTQQRTPCLLVLDGSGSMANHGNMNRLNEGMKRLEEELKRDVVARNRVQIAVIRFGGSEPTLLTDWTDAVEFEAPVLTAEGVTPMGLAVDMGLHMIEERKELYKKNGIPYTRPWMFLVSDGAPTDSQWEQSARRCNQAETNKQVLVWPLGVVGSDMAKLAAFKAPNKEGKRDVFSLDGMHFIELFQWLSASLSRTSQGEMGGTIQIAAPPARMITIET